MPLPTKPPGRGAGNRRVHFPFVCTPSGAGWRAYIAGPCHWYDCHLHGRHTKPCLHEMTGGELVCDRDHDIDEPMERGYLPVYAESNGKPGFVIVYDYDREKIDKLKLHSLVNIERSKRRGDTVAVEYASLTKTYTSTRADLMRPADLTESLLRIWKMPELVQWYRLTHGKVEPNIGELKKRVPKLKPLKSDGKPFDAMHEKAAEKYGDNNTHDAGDLAAGIVNRALSKEEEHRRNGHMNGKPK